MSERTSSSGNPENDPAASPGRSKDERAKDSGPLKGQQPQAEGAQAGGAKDQRKRASKDLLPNKDIAPLLTGWEYEAGTINVRKVAGLDGHPKLQMRLDLGLLQMELDGRPDGVRPNGFESLLDYHENRLADHEKMNGTDLGFALSGSECHAIREEAVMYYHRYLSLFVLEEFSAVVRDTARNLRVLDFCGKFADAEQDRLVLEQYRPYIVMMNTRASASLLFNKQAYPEALQVVHDGLATIREFFERFAQDEAYSHSGEVRVLKKFARDIRKKMPVDPMTRLRNRLEKALKTENYELAAKIRDELRGREMPPSTG